VGINSRFECAQSGQVIVEYSSKVSESKSFVDDTTGWNGSRAADVLDSSLTAAIKGKADHPAENTVCLGRNVSSAQKRSLIRAEFSPTFRRQSAKRGRSLARRSRVCAQTQPFVFALKNAANYGTVRRFFLESLWVPLASGRIEEIAAVNVDPASES